MSGMFSHPSAAADFPEARPELHASVTVPASMDHAWAGLTQHLHLWWPADELSRWGEDSFFDLEDNALVETSARDDENVWGEVTDSSPGEWLQLSWRHVGSASTTVVRIEMAAGGGAEGAAESRVTLTLTHGGWTAGDPKDVYDFYRAFWPDALSRYRRFMGGNR
ncbi:hypothetical protein [Arthrobacter sp. L77]|uniref:hypothetical protein n=1 Tax=Arthrobacter sp. L77 TaxID=1496689 RepID=UPI0012DFECB2|nr:hypothetical protein [Arthrobacter sp. L77]